MGDAIRDGRRSGAHRGAFEDLTARDLVESASLHFWSQKKPEPRRSTADAALSSDFRFFSNLDQLDFFS